MTDHLVSESITVNAPADVVFAILADPRQHRRIDGSGSVRGCVDGPERLSPEAEFRTRMKMFGAPYQMRNWVVEFEENRLLAWKHFGPARWRYELSPEGELTHVTETFDYTRANPVALAILGVLRFPARNRDGIVQTLARLKAAAQADAQTGAQTGSDSDAG